ncbi:polycystic kidney disease 2-like 1 protein [Zootermopsis nevadensis]|uniref:Polycystic kidney disease 2-like 1 protein n=1 Tax=Zootermopsis nevadensis TaxID=136037 RepID=A0A067QFA2_ZOONE|nr:polycystic kidney disease 2-like 1 protein [Zootermopsis nevadensis]KDR05976.1 Polycystic kidney disease 2-like 1 protein [Zootermopsis nevadensis]
MFVAFIFFYTVKKRVDVVVFKRKYVDSVWNGFGLAILMLGYGIICFRIYSYVVIEPQIMQHIFGKKFSNFDSFALYQEIYNFGAVILFTFTWPIIFKYGGLSDFMFKFVGLLVKQCIEIFKILFIFFIIIATYNRTISLL